MLDISDAVDSFLVGQAKAEQWKAEWELNWYKPMIRAMEGAMIQVAKTHPAINQNKLRSGLSKGALEKLDGGK